MLKFSGWSRLISGPDWMRFLQGPQVGAENSGGNSSACGARPPTRPMPRPGGGSHQAVPALGLWLSGDSLPEQKERLPGPIPFAGGLRVWADAETDVLLAEASSAICVQRFDDSRNSAIHITYRISLRSSSVREPRHPLLRVVSGSESWAVPQLHRL